jgi:hypothetical protein
MAAYQPGLAGLQEVGRRTHTPYNLQGTVASRRLPVTKELLNFLIRFAQFPS